MENETYLVCRDCGKELEISEEGQILDGKQLKYKVPEGEILICKCDECYTKDSSLKNYQKCEVFSRVCGYMRPTNQWHKGKQEEYVERKLFKEPKLDD